MRRARTLIAFALAALALAAVAHAQLPSGVSRPTSEEGLTQRDLGAQLYAGNCATCHGIAGEGVPQPGPTRGAGDVKGLGPPLKGVGAEAADFYLTTGFMPLEDPHQQPWRRRVLFTGKEIEALTRYVASLGPGPGVPHPDPSQGSVSEGLHLFTEHCAGCHQVVAKGGFVTGAQVPPLDDASITEIAEAVRTGPYVMPRFSKKVISDDELNSIIAYVQSTKHPDDRGGWGIGNIGPIPEGMVAWLIAGLALVLTCLVIGERIRS
jgi:ubiquinol-cytochrome c reductase cytochrome c subunit